MTMMKNGSHMNINLHRFMPAAYHIAQILAE